MNLLNIQLGDYLCGRLVEEYRELKEVTENFELANEAISEELRSDWAKLSTQPMQDAKKQWQSVFRYKSGKCKWLIKSDNFSLTTSSNYCSSDT